MQIDDTVEFKDPDARKWVPGVIVDIDDGMVEVEKPSGKTKKVAADKVRIPGTTKVVKAVKKVAKEADEKAAKEIIKKADKKGSISGQLHDDFQYAFDWFNNHLFEGKLPRPFWVTVRKRNVLAHYAPKRWASQDDKNGNAPVVVDEMGINPDYMLLRGVEDFLSSIVHEMMHQWQESFAETKPRRGYHDAVWADAMEAVGLMPSSTGAEGGKRTGQSMDHYIVDGKFRDACRVLLDNGYGIRWAGAIEEFHGAGAAFIPAIEKWGIEGVGEKPKPKAKAQTRAKFVCPKCEAKAWAKPTASLMCGDCKEVMEAS